MPVYLLHGFRWPRGAIRIHIILQNLDDAAAEWLVAPATTSALLSNFQEIYPTCMEHLSELRFVEQYDPEDTSSGAGSQPYAYVADVCQEIKLGVDIDDVRGKGLPSDQWAAMMELRDKVAKDEKVAWYVVVCGDEERWAPGLSTSSDSMQQEGSTGASQNEEDSDASLAHSSLGNEDNGPAAEPASHEEQPKGFKKFFSTIGKRKSRTNLESSKSVESMHSTIRDHAPSQNQSNARNTGAKVPASDGPRPNPPVPETTGLTKQTSIPRLQTQDLQNQPNTRALLAHGPTVASPTALSLIPSDDDDHEIITGPYQEEDDDDLAAPAPTVKHGKQQDLVNRQRKRGSIASFTSAVRGTSPETLRKISPIVRTHTDSFQNFSPIEPHQPHRLQQELLPDDIEEEPEDRPAKNITPPASYVPTGAPPSIRSSRSASPVKLQTRQRSTSRLAALNALEGADQMSSSPPRRSTKAARSRRSSVQSGLNARQSQYSMTSLSNAMAQMYGAHEREFNKNRQSVTQDDLVARGLENMDFGALR